MFLQPKALMCLHMWASNSKEEDSAGWDVLQCLASLRGRRRTISGQVLWNPNGLLHGWQQAIPSFTPQGGAKAFWPANEQPHHDIGVLLHTFTWPDQNGHDEGNSLQAETSETWKHSHHCRRRRIEGSLDSVPPPRGSSQCQGILCSPASRNSEDHNQPNTAPPEDKWKRKTLFRH